MDHNVQADFTCRNEILQTDKIGSFGGKPQIFMH